MSVVGFAERKFERVRAFLAKESIFRKHVGGPLRQAHVHMAAGRPCLLMQPGVVTKVSACCMARPMLAL